MEKKVNNLPVLQDALDDPEAIADVGGRPMSPRDDGDDDDDDDDGDDDDDVDDDVCDGHVILRAIHPRDRVNADDDAGDAIV